MMNQHSNSPLSIALIVQSVDDSTGLGRIAAALAGVYASLGHGVHIVSQHCSSSAGVWHRVPSLSRRPAVGKMLFRLFEPGRTSKTGASVLHAFGVGWEADIIAAQSCHKAAVRLQRERGAHRISNRNFGIFDRISLEDERRLFMGPRRKRIVAVSELVRRQILEEYDLPEDAVCVIPNGVHLDHFHRNPAGSHSRAVSGAPFILLFVANEFDRKGLQTIIEALPLLKGMPLEVHVAGNDSSRPYLGRAAELGVRDSLKFLGPVSPPESLFLQADAFVFPTHYEPFGLVITEAMAAGLPVITTRSAGAVETLTDGVHGLYLDDPLSATELAGRIRAVVENAPLRETLSRNGRIAAERFAWPSIAARHIELYRRICA